MVDVPLETPLTNPVELTVATAVLEEIQGLTTAGVPEPLSCEVVLLQKVKVPVIVGFGFTVMVKVVGTAQIPAVGVKVYVVVAVLFKAGAQVPVIALLEVVGKANSTPPEQIGATAVKVGVIFGFTVMVKVVGTAHCPAVGVNV
jgi:hypothetical protein